VTKCTALLRIVLRILLLYSITPFFCRWRSIVSEKQKPSAFGWSTEGSDRVWLEHVTALIRYYFSRALSDNGERVDL